jgi:hypothetical protein
MNVGVRGWVYVISNEAMPGLLKVGFSTKDPHLRARELGNSGSPQPYVVKYDVLIRAPRALEQKIHKLLKDKNNGKEWFHCSLKEAIEAIRQSAGTECLAESLSDEAIAEMLAAPKVTTEGSGIPFRLKGKRATAPWRLSEASQVLTQKRTGHSFSADQYRYDGKGEIKGFATQDADTPWVSLDDVEFVD